MRTNAEAATATNARSAALDAQPRSGEPEQHDEGADRDNGDREADLGEVIDDPVGRVRGVVLDLDHPAVRAEAGLETDPLDRLPDDVAAPEQHERDRGREEAPKLVPHVAEAPRSAWRTKIECQLECERRQRRWAEARDPAAARAT